MLKVILSLISPFILTAPCYACSMCFAQIKNTQDFVALKWAVFSLIGVVSFVLFLCAKFLFNFNKRSRLLTR